MGTALLMAGCTLISDEEVEGKIGVDTGSSDSASSDDTADTSTDTHTSDDSGDTGEAPRDLDGDGYSEGEDCDDDDVAVHPGAVEVCNNLDDDCDGEFDIGAIDATTWYADTDGDGYGDATSTVTACDRPAGYAASDDDCDDGNTSINPAAQEDCATSDDDDCDGSTDVLDALNCARFYVDADGDGYGAGSSVCACAAPAGYAASSDDCEDTTAVINPGSLLLSTTEATVTSTDAADDGYTTAMLGTYVNGCSTGVYVDGWEEGVEQCWYSGGLCWTWDTIPDTVSPGAWSRLEYVVNQPTTSYTGDVVFTFMDDAGNEATYTLHLVP